MIMKLLVTASFFLCIIFSSLNAKSIENEVILGDPRIPEMTVVKYKKNHVVFSHQLGTYYLNIVFEFSQN